MSTGKVLPEFEDAMGPQGERVHARQLMGIDNPPPEIEISAEDYAHKKNMDETIGTIIHQADKQKQLQQMTEIQNTVE